MVLKCCWCACSVFQSCPTFCDPTDCSLLGSSARGVVQRRILEWVAVSSSRGSFLHKDRTGISCISCIDRQILCCWATGEEALLLALGILDFTAIIWKLIHILVSLRKFLYLYLAKKIRWVKYCYWLYSNSVRIDFSILELLLEIRSEYKAKIKISKIYKIKDSQLPFTYF